jgi:predicted  nucleic acid-binding Zn-ribbon protein
MFELSQQKDRLFHNFDKRINDLKSVMNNVENFRYYLQVFFDECDEEMDCTNTNENELIVNYETRIKELEEQLYHLAAKHGQQICAINDDYNLKLNMSEQRECQLFRQSKRLQERLDEIETQYQEDVNKLEVAKLELEELKQKNEELIKTYEEKYQGLITEVTEWKAKIEEYEKNHKGHY